MFTAAKSIPAVVDHAHPRRIEAIDAARGTAMVLVCLSHFVSAYVRGNGAPLRFVRALTLLSAPSFMVVSGTLLGFFYATKRQRFAEVVRSFANRGLFLLTIGRVVLCCGNIIWSGGFWESFKYVYITDTVAVNLIFGPLLVSRMRPKTRLGFAFGLMLVSWLVVASWTPGGWFLELIKETIFGDYEYSFHSLHYAFPLLPWFSLYFASTCLGEALAKRASGAGAGHWHVHFAKVGFSIMGVALFLKSIYWMGRPGLLKLGVSATSAYTLTGLGQKSPPSLLYFLWYGGMGVLMIAAASKLQTWPRFAGYFRWASTVGRSSLLVFMLQYYVYFTLLAVLRLKHTPLWPLYFAISVVFLGAIARAWERSGGNRWLTLRIWSPPRTLAAENPQEQSSGATDHPCPAGDFVALPSGDRAVAERSTISSGAD